MTGPQMGTLRDALCAAFDQDSLDQMLRLHLDKDRGQLAGPGDLRTIVFDLIRLADRQGWLPQLVCAARQDNPGNPALRKWCEDNPDLAASGPPPPPPPISASPLVPPPGSLVARIAGFFLVAVLAAGGAAAALVSQLGRDPGRVGADPLPPGHDAAPPAQGGVQPPPATLPPNQPLEAGRPAAVKAGTMLIYSNEAATDDLLDKPNGGLGAGQRVMVNVVREGAAYAQITWVEGGRSYTGWVEKNILERVAE